MKAIILNKNNLLEETFVEQPIPKSNELLIKIIASGFNPIDYQMLENELERKLISSPILGREFSGIVIKKGENVKEFNLGDEVFCGSGSMGSNGSYAEYISVPEEIVALKPKNIPFEEAAGLPSAGLTALQIYNRLDLNTTNNILVSGASGGVGSFLIKLLIMNKKQNIVVTVGNAESKSHLNNIGLNDSQIIDYNSTNFIKNLLRANNNSPFDIGIDLVGNKMSEIIAETLKTNGIYVDVTALTTPNSREKLFNNGNSIINISNYAYSSIKDYAYYKKGLEKIAEFLEKKSITPPNYINIGQLSLESVLSAHELLKNNLTKGNKLIMKHE
ncbi:NADP-dependent oxidoreductase [Chishuiella sp.]|uniref:NADP-dependent oxidoreductase n=1 Tax=Chishuiella sp. TaxID=1969467 RepID=UPI0028ABDA09|nr:NADP-dependent oxidoreductase [Chishuiella sp.]